LVYARLKVRAILQDHFAKVVYNIPKTS